MVSGLARSTSTTAEKKHGLVWAAYPECATPDKRWWASKCQHPLGRMP
jgi:hypothetical protein